MKSAHDQFYANYENVFGIVPTDTDGEASSSQKKLIEQYNQYVLIFDSLKLIFEPNKEFTFDDVEPGPGEEKIPSINGDLIPSVKNIINFKSGSVIYGSYLDKLQYIIDKTINLFSGIYDHVSRLTTYNTEYQPQFINENTYVSAIKEVTSISIDLLGSLALKYPNRNSRQGLIFDETFNKVLTIIDNLHRRELDTMFQLIDLASKDYKLIKSLETFVSTDRSIDNSVLFNIMSNFDRDILERKSNENLNDINMFSSLKLYFEKTDVTTNVFGLNSFTHLLIENFLVMEPLYDILAYYRLFLFPFVKNTSLVFDLLETLYIYNKRLTKQEITNNLNEMFDIKIANIDYIHLNESKINESLTSQFEGLNNLNHFDIEPYINAIKNTELSTITEIDELADLFSGLKAYDLMMFAITENILYGNLDLSLVMKTLSIKTNIRTIFFKIMFLIAIDKVISSIETYYSGDIPMNLQIYIDLKKNYYLSGNFGEDIRYLKKLISLRDYYQGTNDMFNVDNIIDFTNEDSIWDQGKITVVERLFSLYKEV
jgi:hypothetical protein